MAGSDGKNPPRGGSGTAGGKPEKLHEAVQVALINAAVGVCLSNVSRTDSLRVAADKYLGSVFTAATPTPPVPAAETNTDKAA